MPPVNLFAAARLALRGRAEVEIGGESSVGV